MPDFDFIKQQPILENPPLSLVICQLRFPSQLGLQESDVRPIQKALEPDYPTPEVGKVAEFNLGPAGAVAAGEPESSFSFRSDDGGWKVTLSRNALSLETTAYKDFSDFIRSWHRVATTVVEALEIGRQNRIGLRYVDELSAPANPTTEDLAAIVRGELIGVVGAHPRTERLLTSMHEMRFIQATGACTFRHGLVHREPPVYVLDLDFYDDASQELDLDRQVRLLGEFNHGAYELFEWAVTPELFESFKPREAASV